MVTDKIVSQSLVVTGSYTKFYWMNVFGSICSRPLFNVFRTLTIVFFYNKIIVAIVAVVVFDSKEHVHSLISIIPTLQ